MLSRPPVPLAELRSDLTDCTAMLKMVSQMIESQVSYDLLHHARYKIEELAVRVDNRLLEQFGDLPKRVSVTSELMGPLD
jgi:hypothetical protein